MLHIGHNRMRVALFAALLVAVGIFAAACSSSASPTATATTAAIPPATATTAPTATVAPTATTAPSPTTAPSTAATPSAQPGKGVTIHPARATWNTGWFQDEVINLGLQQLGYTVDAPKTLQNPIFYKSVATGDVDFWANGWFPLHNQYKSDFSQGASIVGTLASNGALQGYLVDKAGAEKYNITNLSDFSKPDVIKAYDRNGDGKADLVGCPPGWGCNKVIDYQIPKWGLDKDINIIQAGYSASMADAIAAFKNGQHILFYTWTPNWTVNQLQPGKDVVWINVPSAASPNGTTKAEMTAKNLKGCVTTDCVMGFAANDIDVVANNKFIQNNPAAAQFLKEVKIPLTDIYAQNAQMHAGQDSEADIQQQAQAWINAHQTEWNKWIQDAVQAAQ